MYVLEDGIYFGKLIITEGIQCENDLDQVDVCPKDLLQQRPQDEWKALPIYKFRDELLKAIEQYQT
ncbi:hypothetical protein ACP4OV_010122 [Aristida adscensionis]